MPDLDLKYESYIREADKPFGCLKNIQTELNTLPQGNTPIHHNTPEQQEDSLAGLDDILQEAIEKAKLFADTNNLNEAHMPEEANSSNNISPVADTPDINENNNPVYTNNNEKTSPPPPEQHIKQEHGHGIENENTKHSTNKLLKLKKFFKKHKTTIH